MRLQVRSKVSDAAVKSLLGHHARPEHFSTLVTGDAEVFKPNGERLLILRRNAIPKEHIEEAWPFMYGLRTYETRNRGNYAGLDRDITGDPRPKVKIGTRYRAVKADGTLSNTTQAVPVRSAIVGYFDRYPRMPFCRESSFSTQRPEEWGRSLPFIQSVGKLFQETVPDRYAKQFELAVKVHPAFVIPQTPFTTLTVNNTIAGAYHTDKGDYHPGFGVMAVFRKGTYSGAEIVFPAYGVATDLHHGDVIFFDPHEVHGNVPFRDGKGKEGEDWIRISMVFYFREKMVDCLSPEKELERAKHVRGVL